VVHVEAIRRIEKSSPTGPVLVVDDDRASRYVVAAMLADAGFETVEASSGRQALELIGLGAFSLVLLDIRMPGLSGLEVLHRLRAGADTRTLPVILVTADDDVTDRVRGLEAGANDYVVKPFDREELLARVQAQMRGQAAWAEVVEGHLRQRAAIASALCRVTPDSSPQATADLICGELHALGHLRGAAILAFLGEVAVVPLAVRDLDVWSLEVERPLQQALSAYLVSRAEHGPWVEHLDEDGLSGLPGGPMPDAGSLACAPLHKDGETLGLLLLRADPPGGVGGAADVSRALSEAIDFAAIAAGLLSLSLRDGNRRAAMEAVLRARAFTPVFQPMVRLDDGAVAGYEALTRFTDGTPPDLRFAEAGAVGADLGIRLELATMAAALEAAPTLPDDRFLSLNVSPTLVVESAQLEDLMASTDRELVLELTEHDRVEDYEALREALARLHRDVSVDDAGSGFASLRHVLVLSPNFMKLDQTWVAHIHRDPARQALVAGLAHFAAMIGCHLIAEGVESRQELETLRELRVELGQGFLFGRPRSVPST
jgi:EAL domain-containing protein (putative c-di-GMP-specific phosphodiesterase class I)/CheY-like chemotaxis protein